MRVSVQASTALRWSRRCSRKSRVPCPLRSGSAATAGAHCDSPIHRMALAHGRLPGQVWRSVPHTLCQHRSFTGTFPNSRSAGDRLNFPAAYRAQPVPVLLPDWPSSNAVRSPWFSVDPQIPIAEGWPPATISKSGRRRHCLVLQKGARTNADERFTSRCLIWAILQPNCHNA